MALGALEVLILLVVLGGIGAFLLRRVKPSVQSIGLIVLAFVVASVLLKFLFGFWFHYSHSNQVAIESDIHSQAMDFTMHQAPEITHTVDSMAISFVGVFLLLFLLAGFVVVVLLLANQKTRPFALALLGVGAIGLLLLLGLFWTASEVHVVDGVEKINTYPPHGEHLAHVPQIELDQARRDMQAIVPMAELVKKLNEQGDQKSVESEKEKSVDVKTEVPPPTPVKEDTKTPDWVSLPSSVGGVYREVVDSGPWSDLVDCQKQLDRTIYEAVDKRVRLIASEELRRRVESIPTLESLGVSASWIQQNVVCSTPAPYVQTSDSSVGKMNTVYVQLEFDANDQEYLRQRYREYVRRDRIAAVTAGGSFILGGIGLLFGLLKVDTWTKGYYTKRLFLGVPAAIIGTGTLLALMMS